MSEEEKPLVGHEVVPPVSNSGEDFNPAHVQEEAAHDRKGLTVLTAAIFVAGEMAGTGIFSLPKASVDASWISLLLIVVSGMAACHTARLLGYCWIILQERYPEFREGHVRYPYPAIAEKAVGKWMRVVCSVCMDFTLFGASVVFLLISAQNIQSLLKEVHVHISLCYWVIIIAAALAPLTWLGTPKDFWPIAVGALSASTIACVLVFVSAMKKVGEPVYRPPATLTSFLHAFGTIAFAFGGHSTFPTIQQDMRQIKKFPKAAILAFSAVTLLYMPVAATGYFVFGAGVRKNVLQSMPRGGVRISVEILITGHLLCTMIIIMNPLTQEFEELFRVPNKFHIKRVILRTVMLLLILFVAESVPHFSAILDLVGGSTVTFLVFVAPPVFYLRLCAAKGPWPEWKVPLHMKVLNIEIILVGILVGAASTYAAVQEIVDKNSFVPPCYVNITAASG